MAGIVTMAVPLALDVKTCLPRPARRIPCPQFFLQQKEEWPDVDPGTAAAMPSYDRTLLMRQSVFSMASPAGSVHRA